MKPKATHTHFRTGQAVHVKLRTGTAFKDVFIERRAKYIVLREAGRIPTAHLQAVSIFRAVPQKA